MSSQPINLKLLWYIHTVQKWDRDRYRDPMESIVSCRNVCVFQIRDRDQEPMFPGLGRVKCEEHIG